MAVAVAFRFGDFVAVVFVRVFELWKLVIECVVRDKESNYTVQRLKLNIVAFQIIWLLYCMVVIMFYTSQDMSFGISRMWVRENIPCKKVTLIMFSVNPTHPIISTSMGFCTPSHFHQHCSHFHKHQIHTLQRDESLNALQENAHSQGKQKHAIEEST